MTEKPMPITSSLDEVLGTLGWSCEHLARRLNGYAAACGLQERVHIKTPYKWINGAHPAAPWPSLIAALVTEELGRPITPTDLGWRGDTTVLVPANADLTLPWTAAGSLRAVRTIAQAGPMDRRALLLLMGTAATAPAHDWLIARMVDDLDRPDGAPLPVEIVDDVDVITSRLRRMDDRLGGGPCPFTGGVWPAGLRMDAGGTLSERGCLIFRCGW